MSKRVFASISLQRGTKNDQVSNVSNGLGNSKGIRVKGGRSLARGGGGRGSVSARSKQTNVGNGVGCGTQVC